MKHFHVSQGNLIRFLQKELLMGTVSFPGGCIICFCPVWDFLNALSMISFYYVWLNQRVFVAHRDEICFALDFDRFLF